PMGSPKLAEIETRHVRSSQRSRFWGRLFRPINIATVPHPFPRFLRKWVGKCATVVGRITIAASALPAAFARRALGLRCPEVHHPRPRRSHGPSKRTPSSDRVRQPDEYPAGRRALPAPLCIRPRPDRACTPDRARGPGRCVTTPAGAGLCWFQASFETASPLLRWFSAHRLPIRRDARSEDRRGPG